MSKDERLGRESWVAIENTLPEHPKIFQAGAGAGWAHVQAICYADRVRTNGFVPTFIAQGICEEACHDGYGGGLLERMVLANLWEPVANGYQIHDYLDHQRNGQELKELSRKRAEAGRLGGLAKSASKRKQTEANASNGLAEVEVEAEKDLYRSSSTSTQDPAAMNNLEPALELQITKLVASVTGKDAGSERIIRRYAERLPLGSVVKVSESASGKSARYAVGALKDELRERGNL